MSFLSKIFGDPNKREIDKLQAIVGEVNKFEPQFEKLKNEEFKNKTLEFKQYLQKNGDKDKILSEAFALVREAGKRTLKQRHFDVQLMGGIVLHQGKIAEMKTGEGKTLAATLAVYLNALDAKGVHVVTVNDYLAKRDCVWMGQIYHALGLSVACIAHDTAFIYDPSLINSESQISNSKQILLSGETSLRGENSNDQNSERDKLRDEQGSFKIEESYLRPISRKEAYQADITYGTNNEFGFDYLRDNLVQNLADAVQRDLYYAIIDEIDSILIDEARTPLIISAPAEESADLYYKLARLADLLKSGEDYIIDEKMRAVTLTEGGVNKMVVFLGEDPWENNNFTLIHHIDAALKAKVIFQKDRDYVVKSAPDGEREVIIVDEFTGRLMYGRRYSEGIHQAIEAKEGIKIRQESRTLATITFQNYFRYYRKLAGMTGTATTEAEEFHKIYNLEVIAIPTNKPMIREDKSDRIYRTNEAKFKAVVEEIKERHSQGQPILVGTGGFTIGEQTVGAIEKNRIIKDRLEKEGLFCQVLDATNHEKEGQIIAQAGRMGAITVATNMAGRGVDIILGGNPPDLNEQKKILELGGLHIIGTERHEARRVDNQLRGRAGRQGDPGSSQFFISLDDDLMRVFGGARLSSLMQSLRVPDDFPIENKIVSRSIEAAQKKVEGFNFDTRKHLLEYDDVLNKHRESIYRRRKNILKMNDSELREEILKMVREEIAKIVSFHTAGTDKEKWDIKGLIEIIKNIFSAEEKPLIENLENIYHQAGDSRSDIYARDRMVKYLTELSETAYQNLEKSIEESREKLNMDNLSSQQVMGQIIRSILLHSIDRYWVYHLEVIENLKGGIGLRAYGQQDPLVEYKRESFKKFNQLMDAVNKQVVFSIYRIGLAERPSGFLGRNIKPNNALKTGGKGIVFEQKSSANSERKIGRNDPCPCGAKNPDGVPVKYKKCHGK